MLSTHFRRCVVLACCPAVPPGFLPSHRLAHVLLPQAATIFAAYLSTVSHEVAIIENERRKVHQPTHVDTIESRNVIMATQFVMPEITEDLAHFVHNFDPVRDKARKDQEKAQRAATREREKREKQEKQMAKQQEAFEQDRLRQQMAFQQAQLGITQSIPSAADAEMEGKDHSPCTERSRHGRKPS